MVEKLPSKNMFLFFFNFNINWQNSLWRPSNRLSQPSQKSINARLTLPPTPVSLEARNELSTLGRFPRWILKVSRSTRNFVRLTLVCLSIWRAAISSPPPSFFSFSPLSATKRKTFYPGGKWLFLNLIKRGWYRFLSFRNVSFNWFSRGCMKLLNFTGDNSISPESFDEI